ARVLDQHAPRLAEHSALRRLHAYLTETPDPPALAASDPAVDWFVAALVALERARERFDRSLAEEAVDLFTGAMLRSRTARSHYVVLRGSVAGFTKRRKEIAIETAAILETNWPERASATYWA